MAHSKVPNELSIKTFPSSKKHPLLANTSSKKSAKKASFITLSMIASFITMGIMNPLPLLADTPTNTPSNSTPSSQTTLPQVDVIGESENVHRLPGSGDIISNQELNTSIPFTGNEAIRKVPGVFIRDEEGLGLRPNISVRGIDGNRSKKLLLLEDGTPISLAPYGENSAYYAPQMDRIDRIEVLKGSGSILYGPQTVGGVINYISKPIPATPVVGYGLTYGSRNLINTQLRGGGTWNQFGSDTFLSYKQGDGPREHMDFRIYDLHQKIGMMINDASDLEIKFHYFNEHSKSTYLGLTTPMYNENPNQNPAVNDVFIGERIGISAYHEYRFADDLKLNTTAYAYTTRRDWWRQHFDRQAQDGVDYERISGTGEDDGSSIFWENSNGGRNRTYKVVGIEPRVSYKHYKFGGKIHYEHEDNQVIVGSTPTSRSGVLNSDEDRSAIAFSTYGLAEIDLNDKWRLTPGLRIEAYDQKREILVLGGEEKNLSNTTGITTVFIPGIGTTYALTEKSSLFGGVHRGFTPPGYSTAISNTAQDQKLDAEKSWNYELGFRHRFHENLRLETTAFFYDYENQITDASASSGVNKANSKNTQSQGIEIGVSGEHYNPSGSFLSLRLAATALESTFQNGDNAGNRLPYTPQYFGTFGVGYHHHQGHNVFVETVLVGDMFSDDENTTGSSIDGTVGKIDAHTVFNISATYKISDSLNTFATVKNILNTKYIASRSPQGIFAGHERQINIGIRRNL